MKVTLLGTSCGVPTPERGLPAVAVRREREIILFDCGEGTQRQMIRFGLSFSKINRVFVTHYHGDHYLGLFGLVQSMSFFGRQEPLDIYGPRGMSRICKIVSNIGNFTSGFAVIGHDLSPGEQVDCGRYCVKAGEVDHIVPTFGYRLEEGQRPGKFDVAKAKRLGIPEGRLYKELQNGNAITWRGQIIQPQEVVGPPRPGRKVVYLGDVLPTDHAVELCEDADLLVCEATFCEDLADRARETGHSTVKQSCEMARRSNVKRLLLTHFSPRYDRQAIEKELDFPGAMVGEDGFTVDVPYP